VNPWQLRLWWCLPAPSELLTATALAGPFNPVCVCVLLCFVHDTGGADIKNLVLIYSWWHSTTQYRSTRPGVVSENHPPPRHYDGRDILWANLHKTFFFLVNTVVGHLYRIVYHQDRGGSYCNDCRGHPAANPHSNKVAKPTAVALLLPRLCPLPLRIEHNINTHVHTWKDTKKVTCT